MATAHLCSLHPVDIPDNLRMEEFVARYDVNTTTIPSLGYSTDVFSGPGEPSPPEAPNSDSESDSDDSESESENSDDERGPPCAWPGQGTKDCEDSMFLPDGPREDGYYLQFGNLTPAVYGVEGHQRCWVSHLGKRFSIKRKSRSLPCMGKNYVHLQSTLCIVLRYEAMAYF